MNLKQIMRAELAPQLIAIRKEKGLSLQDVALQSPIAIINEYANPNGARRTFECPPLFAPH